MPEASTIIIAREDFSIPGGDRAEHGGSDDANEIERHFFDLLHANRPDVVVLDLTGTTGAGLETIRRIRDRSRVPILVVHRADDGRGDDYRICGAAGCIPAPVDIVVLNQTIQHIIRVSKQSSATAARSVNAFSFAGMVFRSDRNALQGPNGASVKLTTLENHVLSLLVSRARMVCSRAHLVRALYGSHPPTSDRAVDVVVNRLRKKLVAASGETGGNLVKTEFRRGYILVADVSSMDL
jgi:two-component system OmpR family response regulator